MADRDSGEGASSAFRGRTVVITGGAGEIGGAVGHRFLEAGANVVLVDASATALDGFTRRAGELSDRLVPIVADVTSEADVRRYVAAALDTFGTIDVFFNNAGIEGRVCPIVDLDVEEFERVQRVNVTGVLLGLKHVLPILYAKRHGSVINTSSVAGLAGTAGVAPYVASKHAVVGLTRTAALEAAPYGVRVNSIHPSPIDGQMMRSLERGFDPGSPDSARERFAQTIPLGRYGGSRDVAGLVMFLASDESAFITGAQIRVDGGMGA